MNTSQLRVVAYLHAKHKASCAEHDPSPGWCDCGATQEPLVKLSDVLALVESNHNQAQVQRHPSADGEFFNMTDADMEAFREWKANKAAHNQEKTLL
jgi:hypothetical protein